MANIVEIILKAQDKATKELEQVQGKLKGMQDQLKPIAAVSGLAFGALVGGAFKAAEAAGIQELAEVKLGQAMKTRGFFTEESRRQLIEYAGALQETSRYGDEQIIQAQTMIAAFAQNKNEVELLTKATLDMAAAKGMDLVGAADLLAKTIGSETNALSRYGITVTGAVGSQERLLSLTEGIAAAFGGAAQAEVNTWLGLWTQTKNILGDVVEVIGSAIIPDLSDLVTWVKENALEAKDWLSDNKELVGGLIKTGIAVTGVVAGLATLGLILPAIISVFTLMLGPIGLVAVGVAGLTAGIVYFADEIGFALDVVNELWGRAYEAFDARFGEPLSQAWDWLVDKVKWAAGAFVELLSGAANLYYTYVVQPVLKGIQGIYNGFRWVMDKLGVELPPITGETGSLFAMAADTAKAAWLEVADAIDTVRERNKAAQEEAVATPTGAPRATPTAVGLTQDQLKAYQSAEDKLTQLHEQAITARTALTVASLDREIQERVAYGEEDFEIVRALIQRKTELAIEAKRHELDLALAASQEALQAELDNLPADSEKRTELLQKWLDLKKEMEANTTEEIKQIRLDADEEVKEAEEKNTKSVMGEWSKSVDNVTAGLKNGVGRQLAAINDQGFDIMNLWESMNDIIWNEIVQGFIEMVFQATVLKSILSSIGAFGGFLGGLFFNQGGVVEPLHAQSGMVIPQPAGPIPPTIMRHYPDVVPVLAAPGEAFLPAWLTNALRSVLGMSPAPARFQHGGTASSGSSGGFSEGRLDDLITAMRELTDTLRGSQSASGPSGRDSADSILRKLADLLSDRSMRGQIRLVATRTV